MAERSRSPPPNTAKSTNYSTPACAPTVGASKRHSGTIVLPRRARLHLLQATSPAVHHLCASIGTIAGINLYSVLKPTIIVITKTHVAPCTHLRMVRRTPRNIDHTIYAESSTQKAYGQNSKPLPAAYATVASLPCGPLTKTANNSCASTDASGTAKLCEKSPPNSPPKPPSTSRSTWSIWTKNTRDLSPSMNYTPAGVPAS